LVRFRYDLSSCLPPLADRPGLPGHGDFYARASNDSVTLVVAGYVYGGSWAAPPAGLSPARTAASVAAPQVPGGTPLRACPALRPRRDLGARPPGASMQPSARSTASAPATIKLTGLHPTACTLPVYASQRGSLLHHATLGSGWRPTFAGWGWLPTGFPTKGFCRHPSCMAFPLPRLFLAQ